MKMGLTVRSSSFHGFYATVTSQHILTFGKEGGGQTKDLVFVKASNKIAVSVSPRRRPNNPNTEMS